MRPNQVYQATVEALEAVLAPRVVSLVLREGLGQTSHGPDDLTLEDVEQVLTGPGFRQLQVLMPADKARETVQAFLSQIKQAVEAPPGPASEGATAPAGQPAAGDETASASPGADQPARLEALRAALRPFNLYFDWPEVRTLRALLQVAEREQREGLDAVASLDDAASQLHLVEQKLEDRLVLQARELGDLEAAYEVVQVLGGPRVRRLEALIGQIRQAQQSRELAEAEAERAATIARDLRKLMESSVAQAASAAGMTADMDAGEAPEATTTLDDDEALHPIAVDEGALTPEASERLRRLDLDAEGKHLDGLEAAHAELLRYLPTFAERLAQARAQLARNEPLGSTFEHLRHALEDATRTQLDHLRQELGAMESDLDALRTEDDGRFERALQVTLDVLQEGLPPHADVLRLRALHRNASERHAERARREAETKAREHQRLEAQRDAVRRLGEAVGRDPGGETGLAAPRHELNEALTTLQTATDQGRVDEAVLQRALAAEQAWEHALAASADGADERQRARLRALEAQLSALPDEPLLRSRRSHLSAEVARTVEAASLDEAHVSTLVSLVEHLVADAHAALAQDLDRLAKEAADVSNPTVLQALQAAASDLQAGTVPDMQRLDALVLAERERERDGEQARWQALQQARGRLESAGVAGLTAFSGALERARAALDKGARAARELDAAEQAMQHVERQIRERLAAFEPRLDAALATFATVERLNNDDVATVRRTLRHLDAQRAALPRVSPGLQFQLDRALSEAEALLTDLAEAYEATRAVADQLVAANVLDDMLGWLGGQSGDAASASEESPERPPPHDAATLQRVMDAFRALDDVDAAAVIGADGSLLAGDVARIELEPVAEALGRATRSWRELAEALGEHAPQQLMLNLGAQHALIACLGQGAHAIVVVRSGGAISALATRLRHRRGDLAGAIAPHP